MNKAEFTRNTTTRNNPDPQIGDVMICRYPNAQSDGTFDGTYKPRPVMIWGGYRDHRDEIVACDVFKITTNLSNYKLNHLVVTGSDYDRLNKGKTEAIDAGNIITLPLELFDTRRSMIRSLDSALMPDLISCRAHGLNFNPSHEYRSHFDFEGGDYREGIFLNQSLIQPISPTHNPDARRPDVEDVCPFDIDPCDQSWLNQAEINAITEWTVAYIQILKINGSKYKWPPKKTWPNWPDVELDGKLIRCCSDEMAEGRDYKPTRKPIYLSASTPRP